MPDGAVAIRPIAIGMVTLRGLPDVTGPALQAIGLPGVPERRMRVAANGLAALWMSPDEVMVTCGPGEGAAVAGRLRDAVGDAFGTAIDMSAARQAFALGGGDVSDMLSALMPVDFDRLAPEEVRRTRMAQVPVALWRDGDEWRLICFRSVAAYAEALLRSAAQAEGRPAGG